MRVLIRKEKENPKVCKKEAGGASANHMIFLHSFMDSER